MGFICKLCLKDKDGRDYYYNTVNDKQYRFLSCKECTKAKTPKKVVENSKHEPNTITREKVQISPSYNTYKEDWQGNTIIRFGVVSDTHLGSKHQQLTHLNNAYDTFEKEGIKTVYHAGDITEGYKMRKGHENEIFLHSTDEFIDYVVDKYPRREGITTKAIGGNHDGSFMKLAGVNIGPKIQEKRKDIVYLGDLNTTVDITPNCKLELNHPLDGSSTVSYSYALQRYADSLMGGTKPNILLVGHYHKMVYLDYRNIHMLAVPCLEAQTPFMRGKRLPAHLGYYIITVHVDKEGTIQRFIPEHFPIYKTIKHDY